MSLTKSRARAIRRMVPEATERKARELYEEVMGAYPLPSVPLDRVRLGIEEALDEMESVGKLNPDLT